MLKRKRPFIHCTHFSTGWEGHGPAGDIRSMRKRKACGALPGACANAVRRGAWPVAARRRSNPSPLGPQCRKCAGSAVRTPRAIGSCPGVVRAHRFPHVARHEAEHLAPGALEPPASVAEAVSSLTIVDAFIAAGESLTPPPRALPSRFICSFPDCSASYNKAWKLDAHLCKHTGEVTKVTGPKLGRGGASRSTALGLVIRRPASGLRQSGLGTCRWVRRVAGLALQDVFSLGTLDCRGEPTMP